MAIDGRSSEHVPAAASLIRRCPARESACEKVLGEEEALNDAAAVVR